MSIQKVTRVDPWISRFWADLSSRSTDLTLGTTILGSWGCPSTIQISRKVAAVGAQSVLNVLLAVSLLNEYLHNRFMQDYFANTFPGYTFILPIGLVAAVAVAGGSYTVYSRRSQNSMSQEVSETPKAESLDSGKKLPVTGTCPFCNVSLKIISENRFQCRKCHRYFRKKVRS